MPNKDNPVPAEKELTENTSNQLDYAEMLRRYPELRNGGPGSVNYDQD